jgi:hypothetical protein
MLVSKGWKIPLEAEYIIYSYSSVFSQKDIKNK